MLLSFFVNDEGVVDATPNPSKTVADVERVIALGKPPAVVATFLELAAVPDSLDPIEQAWLDGDEDARAALEAEHLWLPMGNRPDVTAEVMARLRPLAKSYANKRRDIVLASGVEYNGGTFDSDPASVTNVLGTQTYLNAGNSLPPGFTWRTADNTDEPFTAADVTNLALAMFAHKQACYAQSWQRKEAIDQASTVQELVAIVCGW